MSSKQAEDELRRQQLQRLNKYRSLLIIVAGVLLLTIGGLFWYSQNSNPESLLDELYTTPLIKKPQENERTPLARYLGAFNTAHQTFQNEDYYQASAQFTGLSTIVPPDSLSEKDTRYYQDNIEWMILLARYGSGQITGDYPFRLQAIVDNPQHHFHSEAKRLQAVQ